MRTDAALKPGTQTRNNVKPWETIRLLLACQGAHQRLTQMDAQRKELEQGRRNSKLEMAKADGAIQQLKAEYTSICSEVLAKESEVVNDQSHKEKLAVELSHVRSNQLYREMSEEIKRWEQKIAELEDAELDALERKDSKAKELHEAELHRDQLTERQPKAEREIVAKLDELAAEKTHAVENLHRLEAQFSDGDQSLRSFNRLIERGRLDAIVEVTGEVCPGCHLFIPAGLRQQACALDHIVTCENCGRIIFSKIGSSLHCLGSEDIQCGRLSLSAQLALGLTSDAVRIRDFWGNWHTGKVDGNWLTRLTDLFAVHALGNGGKVRLFKISTSNDYRLEPEFVSDLELEQIMKLIIPSQQPLRLEDIVAKQLPKKSAVYRLSLLNSALRSKLEGMPGIHFRGDLVCGKSLLELRKPAVIPPPVIEPPRPPLGVQPAPTETTITLTNYAIECGEFQISGVFRAQFAGSNSGDKVTIKHAVSEDFAVEFDAIRNVLSGPALRQWYQFNGLETCDDVTLTVRDVEQRVFHIHTEWKRDLNRLLEQLRQGAASYTGRPRDLLYGLLAEANQALNYRDLWFRATEVGRVTIGNVVSTLSRYNRRLFCNVGGGRWGLAEWPIEKIKHERQTTGVRPHADLFSISDEQELWKAIHEIEEHDLVYKLLKRIGCDMSYKEISDELAAVLAVKGEHLIDTSFLNTQDARLQRLENGNWTLKEFLVTGPRPRSDAREAEQSVVVAGEESPTNFRSSRLFWYVLAITLLAVGVSLWLSVKR